MTRHNSERWVLGSRWIGLGRAPKHARRKAGFAGACREALRAISAAAVLTLAAGLNFAMHPDALAAVIDDHIVGFVAEAPSASDLSNAPKLELDDDEVRLLAATAWAEARSEGEDGMRAVAHVIVNRVGGRFGEDVESVIRAPWQFSAWNRGDPNRPLAQNPERYATEGINLETWEIAQRVAREVLSGQSIDPTEGALFYHTRAISPWWSRFGEGRREIGAHVFYRDVPNQRAGARVVNVNAAYDPPLVIEEPPEAPVATAPIAADTSVGEIPAS